MPTHIFFLRGLSTYGQDHAVFGRFNFRPLYAAIQSELSRRGLLFYPITGLGSGSLDEVTTRARAFLAAHPVWNDSRAQVHLLGHSAGGLVARLVEGASERAISSCVTIATAHRGSELAKRCLTIPQTHPLTARALRALRYDLEARAALFAELTPEAVLKRSDLRKAGGASQASVVCVSPSREWCWPLKLMHALPGVGASDANSDGLVERESQTFGEVLGEVNLDHFRQIGMFGGRAQFLQMCDLLETYYSRWRSL